MIVEWEVTLDCNYQCEYCTNGRNSALDKPIKYENDKTKVFEFIEQLKENYPNEELFLFGGEPFLHPFIDEIIQKLNDVGMKFIIQTNFSQIQKIKQIAETHKFEVQISVHPTELKDVEELSVGIKDLYSIIRRVDIMYANKSALNIYKHLMTQVSSEKLVLVPLADFNIEDDVVNSSLFEFNKMKKGIEGKIYNFESGERSFAWEEQMKQRLSFKGNPCIYLNEYILFDPMLNAYNCSYRQNNFICPNDTCFLM